MVELQVHLGQGLLHVLGVHGHQLDEPRAVTQDCPHGADGVRGPEGASEEPDGVEVLEPLAVLDIGLPARDVLDVAGVHQADLEAPGLQELEQGDPVHARRLHRHRGDAGLLQPGRQGEEILGEGPEGANRPRLAIERDADVDLSGAHIDAGRVRVHDGRGGDAGRTATGAWHGGSSSEGVNAIAGRRPRPCGDCRYSSKRDHPAGRCGPGGHHQ